MSADHRAYHLAGQGQTTILFVHGICGSPRQFQAMARSLNAQGYHCRALLLPGHGGDGRAFARCRAQDWLAHVEQAVAEARQQGHRVFLVGHSLGSLLSLACASRESVDGLILINAPLRLRVSPGQLLMGLRILLRRPERDDAYLKAYREAYSITMANPLQALMALRPLVLLWRQMGRTVHLLDRVSAPVLAVQSGRDESVHPRDVLRLQQGLKGKSFELLRLPGSYHSYFTPDDERLLIEHMITFLSYCNAGFGEEAQPNRAAEEYGA